MRKSKKPFFSFGASAVAGGAAEAGAAAVAAGASAAAGLSLPIGRVTTVCGPLYGPVVSEPGAPNSGAGGLAAGVAAVLAGAAAVFVALPSAPTV